MCRELGHLGGQVRFVLEVCKCEWDCENGWWGGRKVAVWVGSFFSVWDATGAIEQGPPPKTLKQSAIVCRQRSSGQPHNPVRLVEIAWQQLP